MTSPVETLRITMLAASLSRAGGGVYNVVLGQSRALANLGISVSLVGLADEYTAADRPREDLIRVVAVPIIGLSKLGYAPGLDHALHQAGGDLVHLHGLWTQPSVALNTWRQSAGKPTVVSPHGMLDPWALRNSGWKKRLAALAFERTNLGSAACLHALNAAERDAIRQYGLTNPVAVVPNGVDLPELDTVLPAPKWASRLPPRVKVLFFLGRLHPKKGLVSLLEAWAQASNGRISSADEWQLVIAGWDEGNHQAELEKQARELGIESTVHFVGPQFGVEKAASLKYADAFILPSHSEGLPISVLEAWSYALPVIMTPQCNLPEGFSAQASIRVETTVESLVEGLFELQGMEDKDRQILGLNGRALVDREFTWGRIGTAMTEVYRWVLGQESKPDCVLLD